MFGLITKISSKMEKREELLQILHLASRGLPGNLIYQIASDKEDPQGIWITETWQSEDHHRDSLKQEKVQAALQMGKPLIASIELRIVTEPLN